MVIVTDEPDFNVPVNPALRKLRQEDLKSKITLSHIGKPYLILRILNIMNHT